MPLLILLFIEEVPLMALIPPMELLEATEFLGNPLFIELIVPIKLGLLGERIVSLILPAPVPEMYFYWIFDGFIPPGLFTMFAHFGMCL